MSQKHSNKNPPIDQPDGSIEHATAGSDAPRDQLRHYLDRRCTEWRSLADELTRRREVLVRLTRELANAEASRDQSNKTRDELIVNVNDWTSRLDQIDCGEVDASKVTLRLREILANAESRLAVLTPSLAEQNEACKSLQEKITVHQYDVNSRVEQLTAKQDVIKALESRLPDQTDLRSINDHLSDYHSMLAIHNELTQRLEGLRVIPDDERSLQLSDLPNEDLSAIETAESISAVPDHEHIAAPLMIAVIDDRIVRCPIKEGSFTIGRDIGNDFRLFTKFVSRRHACIVTRGRDSSIEDLGSKNGVLVNADRVQRCRLKNGDRIDIGGIQFKFIDSSSSAAGNTC